MVTINLKGREIPLLLTTEEMKTIQEEVAPLGDVIARVLGRNPEDPEDRSGFLGPEPLKADILRYHSWDYISLLDI